MPQPVVVENFAADTGQFTVTGGGPYGPGTLTITGGQGVLSDAGGGSVLVTAAADTANMPVLADDIFVYVNIGTPNFVLPAPSSSFLNIAAGIYKGSSDQLMLEIGSVASSSTTLTFDFLQFVASSQHNLGAGTISASPLPDAIGMNLSGNTATAWVRYGSMWQTIGSPTFVGGAYDYTAPGALTGFNAGFAMVAQGAGETFAVTELWSGPPASGTVLVPNVVNTSLAVVAPGILASVGLVVGTVTTQPSALIIAGNVISQVPGSGALVSTGSSVNLVVSSGLPSLRVPDVFGLSQTNAILAITSLGLVVGAIGSAPSILVPPNVVQAQNPTAGTVVAAGSVVSFVLSTGIPAVGTIFDFEATVISQYANSPTILQLVNNLNQYIDQSTNFADFFNFVWNVDTAVGFGLDIWGKIVGVSRLLNIPNTTDYVGFDNGTRSPPDWQSMGSDQPPQPAVGGALYTGYNATSTYLLGDDAYRQLILAKAFANIASTTAPALNTILQNLYGPGTAWVLNTGPMAISYNLNFKPSAIQLAILEQSGVIPTPPGVSVTIVVPP